MKRNSWFNNLFYPKVIEEQKEKYNESRKLVGFSTEILDDLQKANTLEDILEIHKRAWEIGFHNENIGPCPWGYFRCESIPDMTVDQVYLGNRYGLSTKNIRFWNENKNETMAGNGFGIPDYIKCYDIVLSQYRMHMISNIRTIKRESENYISDYEEFVV